MKAYLDLLRDVRENGVCKPTRGKLRSTGEHIDALSVFGRQIRFDLQGGFPLVTTKRVHWPSIVHELIWFLRGSTNIAYLVGNGVHIWDEWADENGELGPVYGAQWRAWPIPGEGSFDQIAALIDGIEAVKADPTASVGRRLIVSAWNVADLDKMALPPCHVMAQFNVTGGRLSCQLYQRSADMFLGVPFNIASYALLTHLVAKVTHLTPGEFIHTFGDAHIYTNHLDVVDTQLSRSPLPLPRIEIRDGIDIDTVRFRDIELIGYQSHPGLRGEVAV